MTDLDAIRHSTRIALPDDDEYLFRLGVALYGFSSVTSFMCEIIAKIDPSLNRTAISDKMAGQILDTFKSAVRNWTGVSIQPYAATVETEFERLNKERSDFVHAYPITSTNNAQILHRRKDSQGKYFEVTSAFLADFISRLTLVTDTLYEIRNIVP